ncbi:MAG: Hpt domain-containing protein [Magnetospirillum sp.]|nr:Hpt domain-containing protein [Magnetospirillum sp.]
MGRGAASEWDVPAGLEDLLPRFLDEMMTDGLRLPLLAGDSGALAEQAHIMRGKCMMFGDTVTSALLRELETAAESGSPAARDRVIDRIVERVTGLGMSLRPRSGAAGSP